MTLTEEEHRQAERAVEQPLPAASWRDILKPDRFMERVAPKRPLYREKTDSEKQRFYMLIGFSACAASFFVYLAVLVGQGLLIRIGTYRIPSFGWLDFLGLAFLSIAIPIAVYDYLERRRIDNLEERMPDLLTDLASLHRAGMTLKDALKVTATGNYGALTPEIHHIADQLRWNVPVLDALEEFRRRVRTPLVERTMTVVIQAGRSGGSVTDVLDLAAANARTHTALKRQRKSEMTMYVAIVYVAFMVFLSVVASLQGLFVPRMVEAVTGVQNSGSGGGPLGARGIPSLGEFRGLFLTVALVQAMGNGFVGGMIGEGHLRAGLKHAAAMVGVSLICFAMLGHA